MENFHGDFSTPFFEANGFLSYDDFIELAQQFGMAEEIAAAFLLSLPSKEWAAHDLIEQALLSDAAKTPIIEFSLTASWQSNRAARALSL